MSNHSTQISDTDSKYSQDTANVNCRILLDTLLAKGVENIVLSPGSRNAPLLIGASCRPFKRTIVSDERTAGFVALGLSLGNQSPTALVCTSGTAFYNYAPAIAEAFYQSVPLIVISADRPMEWIDQDDSQTLQQPEALAKIVKKSFDIPVSKSKDTEMEWFVNRTVNEAVNTATTGIQGPVHINIRLDNPLTRVIEYAPATPRVVDIMSPAALPQHIVKQLCDELRDKKIIVTAGFLPPDGRLNKALAIFSSLPNVHIFAETISNLHLKYSNCEIDTVLSTINMDDEREVDALRPDIVISIGGALVSRKLKEFIRRFTPQEHWTLGDTRLSVDCFRVLTRHIDISPERFFTPVSRLLERSRGKNKSCYHNLWQAKIAESKTTHNQYLQQHANDWSELIAFNYILANLPSNWNLMLSNGTPIRYAQLFTKTLPHASYCNRGVSGIDGTSATAAGLAMTYNGSTLLISGDISFSYDTGIMGLKEIPGSFKIIVINNQGGGIFRFIDSTKAIPQRDEFFCADPSTPVRALADGYGWQYLVASDMSSLEISFASLLKSNGNAILEIIADGNTSAQMLSEYLSLRQTK